MVELLAIALWFLITCSAGALTIGSMIMEFKKKRYFRFGFDCVFAICNTCWLVKFIFI